MKKKRHIEIQKIFKILLLLTIFSLMAGCTPAGNDNDVFAAPSRPYSFYISDSFSGEGLRPIDPQTLQELPAGQELGASLISADSSTGIAVETPEGWNTKEPENIWIIVMNLQDGSEKIRFNPPQSGYAAGLSADGTRLLWQPELLYLGDYPPPVEWFLLDTASGDEVAHLKNEESACFRQAALLDPGGQILYCLIDPALQNINKVGAARIARYDILSGLITAEIEISEALIGGGMEELNGEQIYNIQEPALLMAPGGRQLVLIHAEEDKITLLDAQDLTIERTISLKRSLNLLDLFSSVAQAKGNTIGTIRQAEFSSDGKALYLYSQHVRILQDQEEAEKSGLMRFDLEKGLINAEALDGYQIQWLHPAPDGTLFAFGTNDTNLLPHEIRPDSPSILWHLDGQTLEILAERQFEGFRAGRLVIGN